MEYFNDKFSDLEELVNDEYLHCIILHDFFINCVVLKLHYIFLTLFSYHK